MKKQTPGFNANSGRTVYDIARDNVNVDLLATLLKHGADVNVIDTPDPDHDILRLPQSAQLPPVPAAAAAPVVKAEAQYSPEVGQVVDAPEKAQFKKSRPRHSF